MSQRILVVEGDAVLRDSMWRLLSDHGHQVELGANGAQAVQRSLRARFDTVILDLSLTDIGDVLLGCLSEADGERVLAPSLIGLVEHRHSLAVSKVCEGFFKAILSKPLRLGALLDAVAGASSRPAAFGAALPQQGQGRNRNDSSNAAYDLATAHWRRCGLQRPPRIVACPRPTLAQEKALKLCFDMSNPQDADLIVLLERHGTSEAKRIAPSADKLHRPMIALSPDHADLCEAVFEIASETSWREIASLVRRDRTPSGAVPQVGSKLAALTDADSAMAHTNEDGADDVFLRQKAPFEGVANGLLVSNQKRGKSVPVSRLGEGAASLGDHWMKPISRARMVDRESPSHGGNKGVRISAGAQVLLIEGNENCSPDLTLILAGAGHIVCRVQDAHASMLAAAKAVFNVGVIDTNTNPESNFDLAGLVRSLRGAQRGMPIILVGSEPSGKDRHELAGARGVWFLAKASARENLIEAVSAAISYGSSQSCASESINPYCSPSHRDQGEKLGPCVPGVSQSAGRLW